MGKICLASMTPKATAIMDERVTINEPKKKGKWIRQGVQGNLKHLAGHFNRAVVFIERGQWHHALRELSGVGVRNSFAMERIIEDILEGRNG